MRLCVCVIHQHPKWLCTMAMAKYVYMAYCAMSHTDYIICAMGIIFRSFPLFYDGFLLLFGCIRIQHHHQQQQIIQSQFKTSYVSAFSDSPVLHASVSRVTVARMESVLTHKMHTYNKSTGILWWKTKETTTYIHIMPTISVGLVSSLWPNRQKQ